MMQYTSEERQTDEMMFGRGVDSEQHKQPKHSRDCSEMVDTDTTGMRDPHINSDHKPPRTIMFSTQLTNL